MYQSAQDFAEHILAYHASGDTEDAQWWREILTIMIAERDKEIREEICTRKKT